MKKENIFGALLLLALLTACGGNAEKNRLEQGTTPADPLHVTGAENTETENVENDNEENDNRENDNEENGNKKNDNGENGSEENDNGESGNEENDNEERGIGENDNEENDNTGPADTELGNRKPENNRELFDFIMVKWETGDTETLSPYLSDEMLSLCGEDTVTCMLESLTDTFGKIVEKQQPQVTAVSGIDVYSAALRLEHADVDLTLSLKDTQICGIVHNIRFSGEFDVIKGDVHAHYFLLNGLNAVYTWAGNGESAPAVLMISGSGPNDYNATTGMLSPMEDLALGLAEHGISSLRFEKRTFRFPNEFQAVYGIEDEYLKDCRAALSYLKEEQNADKVYLLGHSLGGQIAAALAAEDDRVDGMILLMSTARHLADICCDQYTALDPSRAEEFAGYRDSAKAQTGEGALGQSAYFGASDAYWASYNTLDTIENIRTAGIPTAIINSTEDLQIFDEDLSLWAESFSADENVTLTVFDDMSHLGYKIDTRDHTQLYRAAEMPGELIDIIVQSVR